MIFLNKINLNNLLNQLKKKRIELDAMGNNLDMPVSFPLDDAIWLLSMAQEYTKQSLSNACKK